MPLCTRSASDIYEASCEQRCDVKVRPRQRCSGSFQLSSEPAVCLRNRPVKKENSHVGSQPLLQLSQQRLRVGGSTSAFQTCQVTGQHCLNSP
jgi:hypothetical protein